MPYFKRIKLNPTSSLWPLRSYLISLSYKTPPAFSAFLERSQSFPPEGLCTCYSLCSTTQLLPHTSSRPQLQCHLRPPNQAVYLTVLYHSNLILLKKKNFFFFLLFLGGRTCSIWKFPSQRLSGSCSCPPMPQPQPGWILNPLSWARDQTRILVDTTQLRYH